MIVCSEQYLETLDLIEALMDERNELSNALSKHHNRLQVIEQNIRALNAKLEVLEKQLILHHYS